MNQTLDWLKDSIHRIRKRKYEDNREKALMVSMEVARLFTKKAKGVPPYNSKPLKGSNPNSIKLGQNDAIFGMKAKTNNKKQITKKASEKRKIS